MMSLETKLILDLAISSKSTTCDVSNILIRKDKHQQKAQEVNNYLNVTSNVTKFIFIILIMRKVSNHNT